MDTKNLIKAFSTLGKRLRELSEEDLELLIVRARAENAWFTDASIRLSLEGIIKFLDEETLTKWTSSYELKNHSVKTVGVVMAGNIPLVGFHDFLSVLICGYKALIKLSSKDSVLIKQLTAML
ncbi:MAG TPA: acyl-CoA reductase, partial [Cyclobacteriaceae bacterium]